MTSSLFSPITLAGVDFANRIHVAPMCQYSAVNGCASDWHMTHLGMLANSGAALLVIEATAVEAIGRISHGDLGLYDDACEAALKRVVDHCRSIGTAKLGIQIAHAGRKASQQRPWEGGAALKADADPWRTIAPSALAYAEDWHQPDEMTKADIARVTEAHVEAAKRALRIGLDEAEIHCAHGYLLHEFCSPLSNQRRDEYGGSLENRLRLPVEIAAAVRAVWPKEKPLGMRITGSDWADGGVSVEEAVVLAGKLKEVGLDFVCVSSGGLVPQQKITLKPGYQVHFAERVKKEAGIATRAVGLIAEPHHAEEIVASGQADMVALARGFLDHPHWGWMAARELGAHVAQPDQYLRAGSQNWAKLFEKH
ncbi:MAG: NADH:flavin oxidoreductase/NADH oxidase [Beijerinckiaceae bacterium]|nr:NADH:flavin oxidoreductase/NADH oxidase [Beijerinckiaceae bacterium]